MRRALLSLLALPLLASLILPSCSGDAEESLAPFQGEGFSIRMPGRPKRSTETGPSAAGPVTVVLYTSEGRGKAFTVGYTVIPAGIEADLAGAISSLASFVKGTATEEADSTYQGFPARDSRITGASGSNGVKATVFVRGIKAGARLYQLQYIQDGADVRTPPAAYLEFLASLKIG